MCCSPVEVVANGMRLRPGHWFWSCNWSRQSADCGEADETEQQLLHFPEASSALVS